MNQGLRQLLPVIIVALFVALVVPRIGQLRSLFEVLAVAGWIIVGIWVLYKAEKLPRPILWLFDRLAPGRRLARMDAEQKAATRRQLASELTASGLENMLDESLIGQSAINHDVGKAIEVFVGKKNPGKPLSIVVAGPAGSGRTTFAEALSAALATYGAGRLLRIDCASDTEIDLKEVGQKLSDLPLPVLLFDNLDKIGDQRHRGTFMTELTRLLDVGAIEGRPVLRHCIVVLTILIDEGTARQSYQESASRPGETGLVMRNTLRSSGHLPGDLLNRIDHVELLKPLEDVEQIAVVWKTFCSMAASEHEIVIVEDQNALGDGIEDFLIAARERWLKSGVSGVREAARFIADVADDALLRASRANHTHVRARWDQAKGQIELDAVKVEKPETVAADASPNPVPSSTPRLHRA